MELNSALQINTNRLILKLIHEKYIDDIFFNFNENVTRYMPFNPSKNKIDIVNFVENSKKNFINKTEIAFVILDFESNFIGCCGIHNINLKSAELGLWLKENSQSQGFGSEIIISLIEFIEQNLKLEYIIYPVDQENIKSRKILEKLGFEVFKTYQEYKNDIINLNIIEYRKYYCR